MAEPPVARPLEGLRVLDMTQFLAGPFATQILADLGAEIVKLEAPVGDWSRTLPPHFVGGESCYYLSINRSKRAIAVDMKAPEGLELARKLADSSDMLIENFRPGVLGKLGFGWDDLSARNPGLIWVSISGFGQTGPYRDRPAYDMIVQAMSGGMSLTGEPDGRSVRAGLPIGDLCAGMYGLIGGLSALEERRRTGRGRFVDISMLDCQVAMLTYQAAYYLHSGEVPGRQGAGHASIPTYRAFAAGNGTGLVITANTERMWQGLCDVLGLPALKADPRFLTNDERYVNREALWPLLEAAFRTREAKEWAPLLLRAGVPVGEVNDLADALSDEQVLHRNMVLEMRSAAGETIRVVGNPIKFAGAAEPTPHYPPPLGAHGREILAEMLGMQAEEIADYVNRGILREH
ncbi:MAG: CoA transferase [Alphaproteobacteria bacterium]|nr:CoA transferase [Alphaproteobacteria bacterium]